MRFSWEHYLDVAEELLAAAGDELAEARWRSAASRAYYAAFGGCVAFLARRSQRVDAGVAGVHEQVIDAFARHPSRGWQIVAGELRDLRRVRITADYHDASAFTAVRARDSAAAARQLLADLRRI